MQHDSRSEIVWISRSDELPTTCCDCGSFTDNQVTVKHVDLVTQPGDATDGCGMVLLTLVFHVALGPIGWILSLLLHNGKTNEDGTKTVKQKSKIKIMQCFLCHGVRPPEIVESRVTEFAFLVHPKFKQGLDEIRERES
jgi:hypothetical protein